MQNIFEKRIKSILFAVKVLLILLMFVILADSDGRYAGGIGAHFVNFHN
jgi:hypothetical protein